ncbi:MAG: winged helix-turn-helix transcriptional regulator [Planctomycetes bacterium]|nr:winged helix-turn-helix transcriptional regulator [Planctomycetota bacterium]
MARTMTSADPIPRLKAMADALRFRILNVLQDGEICVGDLVALLGAPQPTVSRHLGILKRAGLVRVRRSGLWAFHDLEREGDAIHAALLAALEAGAATPLHVADRQKGRRLRTTDGCCPERGDESPCGSRS